MISPGSGKLQRAAGPRIWRDAASYAMAASSAVSKVPSHLRGGRGGGTCACVCVCMCNQSFIEWRGAGEGTGAWCQGMTRQQL